MRLRYLLLAASVLALAGQGLAQGCEGWNTSLFFLSATPAEVESCLAAGAEVNAQATVLGHTPLHLAAQFNDNPAVIEVLLDAGADLKAQDLSGNTPWDYAKDREELIDSDAYRRLSEALGLPAECAEWWSTPEFFETATPAEVRACFPARGDANTDRHGLPPLHHAAGYIDNPAIIWALVEAGAEVNARDVLGHTPLAWAAAYNDNPAIIWTLLSAGAEVDARVTTERVRRHEREDWTPLHLAAAYSDNPAIIQALVDAGAEVDAWARVDHLNWARWTPLHRAVALNDNPAIIEALLDAGADATAIDTEGLTPWDLAQGNEALEGTDVHRRLSEAQELATSAECEGWNTWEFFRSTTPEEVRGCLEAGAEVNARDDRGETPLHHAVQRSSSSVAAALIDAGAEVNARSVLSNTPLHKASAPFTIKILLDAGADMNARNVIGQTPLHHANATGVLVLVDAGADVNARDDRGETPLHHACKISPAAALVLLGAGAYVNARDEDNWTPLYHAVVEESPTLIGALLAAGAWVNIPGYSPLHHAAWGADNPAVIEVLLAVGADASARDQEGKTPWDYAQDNEALRGTDAWWRLREGRFR